VEQFALGAMAESEDLPHTALWDHEFQVSEMLVHDASVSGSPTD